MKTAKQLRNTYLLAFTFGSVLIMFLVILVRKYKNDVRSRRAGDNYFNPQDDPQTRFRYESNRAENELKQAQDLANRTGTGIDARGDTIRRTIE